METGAEESRGGSGDMGRGCVCNDEEVSGNVVEEDKGQGFEGITTKGGQKEEEMTRVMQCEMKASSKGGEGVKVVLQVRGEEEGLG